MKFREPDATLDETRLMIELSLLVLESLCVIQQGGNVATKLELPRQSELRSFLRILDECFSPDEKSDWGLALTLAYLRHRQPTSASLAWKYSLRFIPKDLAVSSPEVDFAPRIIC